MALASTVRVSVNATKSKTADFEDASSVIGKALSIALTDGAGANQADLIFKDTVTLAASGTADLDLSGSLTDVYGAAQVFARLKAIIVIAAAANTNNVNVTRPASNGVPLFLAASDGLPVKPGGAFVWVAPDATGVVVTASTGDLITFTNSAGTTSVTYDVILIGASA